MTRLLIASILILFCLACSQDKPKINYKDGIDTTSIGDDRVKDTTKILVADPPVKFDSTNYRLFAIQLVDLQERGGYKKYGSGSYTDADIVSSYTNHDDLIGNFINLVFQDASGNDRKLTDKKIAIRRVQFLRGIFKSTRSAYLLYSIFDRDSNHDKELNYMDLEALYISKIDGTEFKKITKELHELYDWTAIKGENRIYFRTLEDQNKDGELTNKDKFHYYFIDFANEKYSVNEYNPVKAFQ